MGSTEDGAGYRCAVLGSPVEHSLSPVLHGAAYAALGLTGWSYERVECDADRLPGLVSELDGRWRGLSVTMPGKHAALAVADEVTDRAAAVGAANTLLRLENGGWRADCTDVDGVRGALTVAGRYTPRPGDHGLVLGAGGTAAAALVAFAGLGITTATLVARTPARAVAAVQAGRRAGLAVDVLAWDAVAADAVTGDGASFAGLAGLAGRAAVLVCTVPPDAVRAHAAGLSAAGCVLDAIYHPWPTPLAEAVLAAGRPVATGLDMLLHQAFGQVEQFTGHPAPRAAMRDALREATGGVVPLDLGGTT